jgi:hypothetical protein
MNAEVVVASIGIVTEARSSESRFVYANDKRLSVGSIPADFAFRIMTGRMLWAHVFLLHRLLCTASRSGSEVPPRSIP